jgi:uncharacterized protein with PQ loop repeat
MMDDSTRVQLIGWLFLVTNSGRLLAYIPQMVATARCESGARSVSILTWGYFVVAHLSGLLYAITVLHDTRSIWIFSGNLLVTVILVAIILWKRYSHKRDGSVLKTPLKTANSEFATTLSLSTRTLK